MSRALQNFMARAAASRLPPGLEGLGMTRADFLQTLNEGQPYPWVAGSGASLPGMAPAAVRMGGLSDVPADYGAGEVFAPDLGQGPLGALPAALTDFWGGLPTVGKVAVGVGAYMILRRFLR